MSDNLQIRDSGKKFTAAPDQASLIPDAPKKNPPKAEPERAGSDHEQSGNATRKDEKPQAKNPSQPIETAPKDNHYILVCATPDGEFIPAYWRKTRTFNHESFKWDKTGRWTSPLDHRNIGFDAKWWKNK